MSLHLDELGTVAAIAGGAVAVVGLVAVIVRRVWRWLRRIEHFLVDWLGEDARPGVPARPGVMPRLAAIEDRVGTIEAELHPNHGSSLRDAVTRIERTVGTPGPPDPDPAAPPPDPTAPPAS